MAETEDPDFSLLSLEDELTCSICLSTFDCPVTIPCGHNFCQDCLLATWKDSYSCPQCRTVFATKPELKKNTVLSTVVETFSLRSSKSQESNPVKEETKAQVKRVIRCDTCMEAEASKTCLTCMASYCEEHLRPHRENPNFAVHQLSEPVGDLLERICPDHHKLMELFCSQHSRPICSLCLQHVHKGCSFITPEEQRSLKESELREKLSLLDMKIERTDSVMFQMTDVQSKLKDGATKRKTALAALYQNMRDMLAQDEREAQTQVDRELEAGQAKLQDFLKKFADNATRMRQAKEDIIGLLSESQTSSFLQASFDLPRVVKFEPHVPRINLDSVKVTATQAFAAMLKDYLTETLKQPVEERLPIIKPTGGADEKPAPVPGPAGTGSQPSETPKPPEQRQKPSTQNPPYAPPPPPQFFQQFSAPRFSFMSPHTGWSYAHNSSSNFRNAHPFGAGQKTKQDKRPPSAAGGHKQDGKPPDQAKKDKPKGHPPSAKSTKHPPRPKKN